jgi:hypothetical protein
MYQNNKQSIEDRIVSLTQPHIRPIVRGKAGKPGEFGAKFSASCIDGYIGSAEKVFPGGRSQESGVRSFGLCCHCFLYQAMYYKKDNARFLKVPILFSCTNIGL